MKNSDTKSEKNKFFSIFYPSQKQKLFNVSNQIKRMSHLVPEEEGDVRLAVDKLLDKIPGDLSRLEARAATRPTTIEEVAERVAVSSYMLTCVQNALADILSTLEEAESPEDVIEIADDWERPILQLRIFQQKLWKIFDQAVEKKKPEDSCGK